MWSGEWHALKASSRTKYENWRASRSLVARGSTALAATAHAVRRRVGREAARARAALKRRAESACVAAGVTPVFTPPVFTPPTKRLGAAALVLLLALGVPAACRAVDERCIKAPRRLALATRQPPRNRLVGC